MKKKQNIFSYEVFNAIRDLPEPDQFLLKKAREATANAYAPYSQFHVGAAALLQNGEIVAGANQENASSPAGLCAERVLLAAVSSLHKFVGIDSIAISYDNKKINKSTRPVAPCGICRQSLLEYQAQQKTPIRLILGGMEGEVFIIDDIRHLLPLSFSGDDMA